MAENNDLGLQAFARLEAASDISEKKIYEPRHRARSLADSIAGRKICDDEVFGRDNGRKD
jgi:hypothetical protein